jgi:hypothetical protein
MVAARRTSVSGMGYVGIPALIFIEFTNYGRGTQTYEERRVILHKIYGYLRGYLPEIYDKADKRDEYNERLDPRLVTVCSEIKVARNQYKPTFELMESCDPDEKLFQETMDGIFEQLSEIVAISKVIDKEKMDNVEVIF